VDALPLIGMGVVVTVSVGFGMGTLVQFDQDWRAASPVQVAHAFAVPAAGTASLAEAVTAILADTGQPVDHVECSTEGAPTSVVAPQLCRAHTAAGMVSILAASSHGVLDVTVFAEP
jgi:hypothetical protein